MSNITRRAVMAGIAASSVAAGLPTAALALGEPSSEPSAIGAMVTRSAEILSAQRWSYVVYKALHRCIPPEVQPFLDANGFLSPDTPQGIRDRNREFSDECARKSYAGRDPDADLDEQDDIEDSLQRTPARAVGELLAKIRWLVDNLPRDAALPDLPTLETAYSWTGSEYRHEPMVVSIWADAERLLGGGRDGEI